MKNCLIIDDDQAFCKHFCEDFGSYFLCHSAHKKVSAEVLIKNPSFAFDVIILDLYFPEKSQGLDFLPLLKLERFGVPIIVITNEDYPTEDIAQIARLGVYTFLSKRYYNIKDWHNHFAEAIESAQRHILFVYERLDQPFAGWIGETLKTPNWHISLECGNDAPENWLQLIQNNHAIVPILSPEATATVWFKEFGHAVNEAKAKDKIIPLQYRPCHTEGLRFKAQKLVDFCGNTHAFFDGREQLIHWIYSEK